MRQGIKNPGHELSMKTGAGTAESSLSPRSFKVSQSTPTPQVHLCNIAFGEKGFVPSQLTAYTKSNLKQRLVFALHLIKDNYLYLNFFPATPFRVFSPVPHRVYVDAANLRIDFRQDPGKKANEKGNTKPTL